VNRLAATFKLDFKVQYRQGFYFVSVFVMLTVAVIIPFVPTSAGFIIPAVLLTNMVIITFVFLGGLLLLEKGQGTLEGLIVTPLRPEEYLVSKVVTLTTLAVAENIVITILAMFNGMLTHVNWGWVLFGSVLSGMLYTLFGFLTVIRYNSLNDFLMPMVGATLVLQLPSMVCFGMPEFWLLYLLPTHGPLILFRAAIDIQHQWQVAYAVVYPTLWIALLFWVARRALHQFVTRNIGEA